MKYYFLVNKNSGGYKKEKLEDNIRKTCLSKDAEYSILYTKDCEDTKRLIAEIGDKRNTVIFIVGGDGTINGVLDDFAESKNRILGIIPTGSGNDFYRALHTLSDGIHNIDIGRVNGRYFINVACIGFDADVANRVEQYDNNGMIPPSQKYNVSLLYTFFTYEAKHLDIRIEDFYADADTMIFAVCNGQCYGGGYRIAPHALLDDGFFDIYLLRKVSRVKFLRLLLALLRGNHEKYRDLKHVRASKITVDCREPYTCNIDGEKLTSCHFDFELIKNGVRLFKNEKMVSDIMEGL